MKVSSVLVILFSGFALGTIVTNVRLIDHTSYFIDVVTKTVNTIEEMGWCNLKLPNHSFDVHETVLNSPVIGKVEFINGFAVSIQHVDILQSTVQQVWNTQMPIVTVRGTFRMHDVAVGYDVVSRLQDGEHHHTAVFVHPLITYQFTIIKNVANDVITGVTVVGTVPVINPRLGAFRPLDDTSDVLGVMYDNTLAADGITAWGPEILQPIAYNLVMKEIEFPTVCYNCNT